MLVGTQIKGIPTLKQLVANRTAALREVWDGSLWYEIEYAPGTPPFRFPVPFVQTAGAHFGRDMKAVELMRWIRAHLLLIDMGNMAGDQGG